MSCLKVDRPVGLIGFSWVTDSPNLMPEATELITVCAHCTFKIMYEFCVHTAQGSM
jgi:hypothetical protein